MTPFRKLGVSSFVDTHGPSATCRIVDDGYSILARDASIVIQQLAIQAEAIKCAQGGHIELEDNEALREEVSPLESLQLPSIDLVAWMFDKYPVLATPLNMIFAMRRMQIQYAKAFMTWTSSHMMKNQFLSDGFGKQLSDLDASLDYAGSFQANAQQTIVKLAKASELTEFEECKDLAPVVHEVVKGFERFFNDCEELRTALRNSAIVKGSATLTLRMEKTKDWDPDFRVWMGVRDVSTRSNRDIKKYMTSQGAGTHTATSNKIDKFEILVGTVSAATSVLRELRPLVEEC